MTEGKTTRYEAADAGDDLLRSEFARLSKQPVGRGPEAGELWARAEVVRRLESQSLDGREGVSAPAIWAPLAGALAALLLVAAAWLAFGAGHTAEGSGNALGLVLGIVVGSLGVLTLAACSSLAILWNDL